jgi:hypothetical protein
LSQTLYIYSIYFLAMQQIFYFILNNYINTNKIRDSLPFEGIKSDEYFEK